MGRKNSPSANKELNELIAQYETAKAENRQLYLDGDQLADIADRYAAERKFDEAQEVITYGLHLHPESTDLLVEQAYLYLDTGKIPLAKNRLQKWIAVYFPEYKGIYTHIDAKGGLLVLKQAPTPEEIVRLGVEGIIKIWKDAKLRGNGHKKAISDLSNPIASEVKVGIS